jgi:hypothetical protein
MFTTPHCPIRCANATTRPRHGAGTRPMRRSALLGLSISGDVLRRALCIASSSPGLAGVSRLSDVAPMCDAFAMSARSRRIEWSVPDEE